MEISGKDANLGRPLVNPPTDGITALRFSANSDLLLCASWDGVRVIAYHSMPMHKSIHDRPAAVHAPGLLTCCAEISYTHTAQTARLYDALRNQTRGSFSQPAPVLDATFQEDSGVFLGGLDGAVKRSVRPLVQEVDDATVSASSMCMHGCT